MAFDYDSVRTHFLGPDFRRIPKTKKWCCICSRDLKGDTGKRVRVDNEADCLVIHPDDATEGNSYAGWVGPECAKQIPPEFFTP